MKLYEINEEILRLTDQIVIDEETGEVGCDLENICSQIDSLRMEKQSILEYLAKLTLNLRAEQAAVKAEETRLHDRRVSLEKKEKRLLQVLDRECNGEKTDLGVATLNYRKTSRVNVTDRNAAVIWLQENHEDFIRYQEPEISKNDVKKLLAEGTEIPGCSLVEERSYSLK
ncbi:MAG: siphovirus Gp157 family protein [Clostridia bacterium]|nr:siphovirus Gp157 family protein [Clostridia bacterium]